ncbi:multidrug resistance-associated protein 5 isoform X5 [Cryptotermes secundus]|uniref:multidrug resistance-associated protein 5 isoform X5 n=1 Tax=Cryptotermes secundus TaxID=105785 RepID=UPI001454D538|nr:multidrug resistance-associated protein 5 isoform X5 [Cryptotermes secundus]
MMAATAIPVYRRLRPDTPDLSTDGSISENISPPLPHQVHLPTKVSTVRYVPHSGWTRYIPALQSLAPFRRNRRLHYLWREEAVHTGQAGLSFFTVMWRFVRTRIIIAVLIYTLGLAFSILGHVICLEGFLIAMKNITLTSDRNSTSATVAESGSNVMRTEALMWAIGIIATELLSVLLVSWNWSITCRTATRLRSATLALIYSKLVQLSNLNTISTQQMVMLLGTDGQKLYEATIYGPYIITAPLVFVSCIVSFIFISTCSGVDALITTCVLFLTYPLLCVLVRLTSLLTARATALCNRRLALVYEMLVHIRLVKMTTRESLLLQQVTGARHKELGFTKQECFIDGFCTSMTQAIPVMALLLYLSFNVDLEAFQVFPILALFFYHMKNSLFRFWLGIKTISDVLPSLERFKAVMLLNETNKFTEKPINRLMAVNISNASFVWDSLEIQENDQKKNKKKNMKNMKNQSKRPLSIAIEMGELAGEVEIEVKPMLVDITFLAPKGKLIGICGEPRCGKTSLLLAVLGHLRKTCGQVLCNGNCAYVGQRPWIWTASFRDNIVFKEHFQSQRYYNAVHSCSLTEDIDKLSQHDDTQIDEMVLSAGQKQRIALARALYSNKDIILLDSPLSMVDADTAAAVFDKCILKGLHGRTVILATRHLQFLTRCDEVYVMSHGKIVSSGTHEHLMQHCPKYSSLIKICMQENAKNYFVEDNRCHESKYSMIEFISQNICHADSARHFDISKNEAYHPNSVNLEATGPVGTYMAYSASVCRYIWIVCGLLSLLLCNLCLLGIPLCVLHFQSQWDKLMLYLIAAFLLAMCLSGLVWSFSFTTVVVRVSQRAHNVWFGKLCRAPMGYFRASRAVMSALNLFSLDVRDGPLHVAVDVRLPLLFRQLLENAGFFLCAAFVLLYISPYSLVVIFVILLATAVVLGLLYRKCLLKLHEMEVMSRVPLYQHLMSTITGRSTIQAFAKEKEFIADFTRKCDDNATCMYLLSAASCWLAIRVHVIAAITVGLTAVMLVFATPVPWSDHIPTDWVTGLALVTAMQMSGCLQSILHSLAESEARLKIFAESSRCIEGIKSEDQTIKSKRKLLLENWPTDGSITFENVTTVTSPGVLQSLDGMSFRIETGQKIGVVGLPGSGKKLLVDTLFRLVDVEHGKVLIGSTDLTCVPLHKLRSRMAIVPQDPVLFTGTIRLNIDPHEMYSDSDVWESLQKVNLQERIENLPHKLKTPVDRNGDRLSVGERQMLYLARACLQDTKVLVLEEPLATVEDELDGMLNHMACNLFPTATILTIAHQIKYVVQCDKIMVVDGGKVVEFDTPANLYHNQQSYFTQMISSSMGNLFETEL